MYLRLRATTALAASLCLVSCADREGRDPGENVLLARQKFAVELRSWAPLPDGRVAVDVEVILTGSNGLERLTVEVRQVGPDQALLRSDRVPLDVSRVEFDGRMTTTLHVPSAGEEVAAVAVVREANPPLADRAQYPEFGPSS